MMKYITSISFLIACLLQVTAFTQHGAMMKEEVQAAVFNSTSGQDHRDPYMLSNMSFKTETPYLLTTAGLFGVGWIFLETNKKDPFSVEELMLLDRNEVNSFDRGATYNSSKRARSVSDWLFNSSMVLPTLVFLSNKHTRQDVLPLFILGAEAFLITGAINMNAKHIFNRSRPYVYNPDFSIETRTNGSSRLSFFSGHTSQAAAATFFLAKVIGDYHPDMKKGARIGMWSAAVALPAVTGILRVESGRHYNTDVIAGYLIGATVGWLIPHLRHKKGASSKLSLRPFGSGGASGLSIALRLS